MGLGLGGLGFGTGLDNFVLKVSFSLLLNFSLDPLNVSGDEVTRERERWGED